MKEIPYDEWQRKEHCEFYKNSDIPFYSTSFQLDVKNLYAYAKKKQISFYYAAIYVVTKAVNQIEEFKTRLRGDRVIIYDSLIPSFTDLEKGSKLHKIVKSEVKGTIEEYCKITRERSEGQAHYFPTQEEEASDNYIFVSCLPWFSFSSITNPLTLDKDDFIPRINWGKFEKKEETGEILMPFSIQLNHRAADGIQIAEFIEALKAEMNLLTT